MNENSFQSIMCVPLSLAKEPSPLSAIPTGRGCLPFTECCPQIVGADVCIVLKHVRREAIDGAAVRKYDIKAVKPGPRQSREPGLVMHRLILPKMKE